VDQWKGCVLKSEPQMGIAKFYDSIRFKGTGFCSPAKHQGQISSVAHTVTSSLNPMNSFCWGKGRGGKWVGLRLHSPICLYGIVF